MNEIALTPFPVLTAIWKEYIAIERAKAGEKTWEPDGIVDPTQEDGRPPKELFIAYAACLSRTQAWAEREWMRQTAHGGLPLPKQLLTPEERQARREEKRASRSTSESSAEEPELGVKEKGHGRVRRRRGSSG